MNGNRIYSITIILWSRYDISSTSVRLAPDFGDTRSSRSFFFLEIVVAKSRNKRRNKRRTNRFVRFHIEWLLDCRGLSQHTGGLQFTGSRSKLECTDAGCSYGLVVPFPDTDVSIEILAGTYLLDVGPSKLSTAMCSTSEIVPRPWISVDQRDRCYWDHCTSASARPNGRSPDLDFGGNGHRYWRVDRRNAMTKLWTDIICHERFDQGGGFSNSAPSSICYIL